MRDVDDPSGRMDKTMDEMLITKRCYQHYRPQPSPHFIHNQFYFDYNNNLCYYFKQNKKQNIPTNLVMTSVLFHPHSYIGKYLG